MKGNAATGGIGEDACEVAGSNTRGTADDADRQEDDDEEARDDDDGEDGEGGASQDQGKKNRRRCFCICIAGLFFLTAKRQRRC